MGKNSLKQQLFSGSWWRSWLSVIGGSILLASAFVLFINPYHIVPGGVYGTGVVLHYLFPSIPVGTFGLMLDVPLLLIAFKVFGGMFGARTIVAALITPLVMNGLTLLIGENPATMLGGRIDLSNDIILACIFGGVVMGVGVGMVIRTRATTGGTDVIAMILTKYFKIKFSNSILIVDSIVVIFGMIVLNDLILPLYSLVTIYVAAQMINFVVEGTSYDKLLFIVSKKHVEMKRFILEDLSRGATYIKSKGMYSDASQDMIFLVVSRRELALTQEKIKEIDPEAFVVVLTPHGTFGDGFKTLPDKL